MYALDLCMEFGSWQQTMLSSGGGGGLQIPKRPPSPQNVQDPQYMLSQRAGQNGSHDPRAKIIAKKNLCRLYCCHNLHMVRSEWESRRRGQG